MQSLPFVREIKMYPVATKIMAEATRRCQVLIGREKDARMLFLQYIPPPVDTICTEGDSCASPMWRVLMSKLRSYYR